MSKQIRSDQIEDLSIDAGTRVGNYFIQDRLGSGGIGTVYRASHRILDFDVAVKFHDYFPRDKAVGVAFLRAANYLSQLSHPNIVRLYDYGFWSQRAYMVMELVSGQTLHDLIPSRQTPQWTSRAIDLFVQILSAVRYAHNCIYNSLTGERDRGILHGDIKPQNIFIDDDCHDVKLSDFMIPDVQEYLGKEVPDFLQIISEQTTPISLHEMQLITKQLADHTRGFGTPYYMAPEQWKGKVTIATDIFSLGATLYQMVTGLSPREYFDDTLPRHVNPHLPNWVGEIIGRCLAADPEERFGSVAEIEAVFLEQISRSPATYSIIEELIMGDKFDVKVGNVSNVGQMFIGKFNSIVADLEGSGNHQLAEVLRMLKDAIMASNAISEEKKGEHIEVINQIGQEAAKNKPNKTLIKIIWDGMVAVLKDFPDVAKAVTAVAPFFK